MTDFLNKLATRVKNSEGYKQASGSIFDSYVLELIGQSQKLEQSEIKKLVTSAQIFYKSDKKELKNEGAVLLSMILDLCADEHKGIVAIANSTFADSGDFPNIQLLTERHPELNFSYNLYSQAQLEFRQTLNSVEELDFTLTDFQRSLWDDLSSDKDVITAAPTSAGKTHIILNYLLNKVVNSDGAFAAIVVPTRALISEVAGKIYELSKKYNFEDQIEICTIPKEGGFKNKTFFVMTQERLHEILLRGDMYFNYLFIDEAHNIADKSRGVLLHLTVEKMLEDSVPQIIISMPSSNYQNAFSTIFKNVEFKKEITQHSPVAKVIMSVVPKGKELIISRHDSTDVKHIPKGFTGTKLADIVYKLGKGQSNIIYRNRTDYCENIAREISARITETEQNLHLEEAADYVEKFIHTDFSLADNLRKGVAFHYGPLPSSIRIMVENLVKDGHIKYISCTSTLAEGINLPAKNLFLQDPTQPIPHQASERIEDVKINNITGRAGRMLQHFSGNIFRIEPEKWTFKDYFDDEPDDEQRIPTYYKSLNEELNLIITALRGEFNHDEKDQYRIYTIANKLIKEFANNNFENTLQAEELTLTNDERNSLHNSVKQAHDNLKVASFTLEANPTVGYIQQNKLFTHLDQQLEFKDLGLPHPKATNFYESMYRVCSLLHDFGIFIPTENYTLKYICVITGKWIKGNSLKDIISEQIEWDANYAKSQSKVPPSINTSVRNVIKVINNDIRFRLSNALRCYQILLNNIFIGKNIDFPNIKIHSYIEIGACEDRMINLINMGLSREAAKEIDDTVPDNETIKSSAELLELHNSGKLAQLHAITDKELTGLFT